MHECVEGKGIPDICHFLVCQRTLRPKNCKVCRFATQIISRQNSVNKHWRVFSIWWCVICIWHCVFRQPNWCFCIFNEQTLHNLRLSWINFTQSNPFCVPSGKLYAGLKKYAYAVSDKYQLWPRGRRMKRQHFQAHVVEKLSIVTVHLSVKCHPALKKINSAHFLFTSYLAPHLRISHILFGVHHAGGPPGHPWHCFTCTW